MGRHFDLQAIYDDHHEGRIPEGLDKAQRWNFRKSADKFSFKKGKLLKPTKRANPIPGGEYLKVVVSRAEQLKVARKLHR